MERVLRETRFLVLLELVPGGRRAAANVLKLLDQARAHWREGGYGLEDFVRWLWERTEKDAARESESPAAEDESRVSLLTIHGAKGLEWRVVALFATHHRRGGRRETVLIDRHTRRVEAGFSSFLVSRDYDALARAEAELACAERARLLYVALTRACERLVLPCFSREVKVAPGSLQELLALSPTWRAWVDEAVAGRDPEPPAVVCATGSPVSVESADRQAGAIDRDTAQAARQRWRRQRAEALERGSPLVVVRPSAVGSPGPVAGGGGGDPRARDLGKGLHRLLQWLLEGEAPPADDRVDLLARRVGLDLNLDEGACRKIATLARRALATELLSRAWRHRRWCEWPVMFKGNPADLGPDVAPSVEAMLERRREGGGAACRGRFSSRAGSIWPSRSPRAW
ncbi:MAG: 3'-5' exonuclease [Acidobacteriota bacterium]|nr:3'-5' exonuclease [Acidobacteriota bacterium]